LLEASTGCDWAIEHLLKVWHCHIDVESFPLAAPARLLKDSGGQLDVFRVAYIDIQLAASPGGLHGDMLGDQAVGGLHGGPVRISEGFGYYCAYGRLQHPCSPARSSPPKSGIPRSTQQQAAEISMKLMVWLALAVAITMTFLSGWIVRCAFSESEYREAGPVLALHIWGWSFRFFGRCQREMVPGRKLADPGVLKNRTLIGRRIANLRIDTSSLFQGYGAVGRGSGNRFCAGVGSVLLRCPEIQKNARDVSDEKQGLHIPPGGSITSRDDNRPWRSRR
jgi:hypothetical protein